MEAAAESALAEWDIVHADGAVWMPWGAGDDARAKVLGSADGYVVALVEAQAGSQGTPHEHACAEFFHLLSGTVRNQGVTMSAGGV